VSVLEIIAREIFLSVAVVTVWQGRFHSGLVSPVAFLPGIFGGRRNGVREHASTSSLRWEETMFRQRQGRRNANLPPSKGHRHPLPRFLDVQYQLGKSLLVKTQTTNPDQGCLLLRP